MQSDLNYALQDAQRTVAAWYGDELRAQELQSALNDSVDDAIKARAAQRHAEMVSKELQVALDNAHRCRAHSEVDAIAELMPSSGANDVLAVFIGACGISWDTLFIYLFIYFLIGGRAAMT